MGSFSKIFGFFICFNCEKFDYDKPEIERICWGSREEEKTVCKRSRYAWIKFACGQNARYIRQQSFCSLIVKM